MQRPMSRSRATQRRCLRWSTLLSLLLLLATAPQSFAQGLYEQGAKRVSVIAGVGRSFDDDYLILGIGAGYFPLDGLEVGVNWQVWLVGDPLINQITPEITYVFRTRSVFDPYIGGLYRWTLISGFDNLAAWGGRAGVNIATGARSYVGVGAVALDYTDCSDAEYGSCTEVYPEFTFAFSF